MDYSRAALRESLDELGLDPERARDFVDRRVMAEFESRFGEPDLERLFTALNEDPADYLGVVATSMLVTYAVLGEIEKDVFEVDATHGPLRPLLRLRLPRIERWTLRRASIGLLDRGIDPRGRRFGITIGLPRRFPPVSSTVGVVRFPRLRIELPLSVTRSQPELHSPMHPENATTTCYGSRSGRIGIVTAGHAVKGLAPQRQVALDTGEFGRLIRSGYRPIDAAFIEIPHPPSGLESLPVRVFPVPGDELLVRTRRSAVRRAIADVGLTRVEPNFRDYPLNFLIDAPFARGDSGALVRLVSGEALGIYVGSQRRLLPTGAGTAVAGVAQNFAQAMYALKLQPLDSED